MNVKKSGSVVALGFAFVFATQDPEHVAILPHVPELPIPTDTTSLLLNNNMAYGGTAVATTSAYSFRYPPDDGS